MKRIGTLMLIVTLLVGLGISSAYGDPIGQIDAEDIELVRDVNGDYTFIFKEVGEWSIFASKDPSNFSNNTPIASTSESKITIKNFDSSNRYYFKVVNKDKSETVVSERRINFKGEENTRDLGGYKTKDGRTVKWGKLYRSGALNKLTDSDRILYDKLKIDTVVDFRAANEQVKKPDNVPKDTKMVSAPIMPGDFRIEKVYEILATGDKKAAREQFIETKRGELVEYNDSFQAFFDAVESSDNAVLYHCAGGKDRTGFASFLLLHALGVDKEIIVGDYLDTNKWRVENIKEAIKRAKEKNWDVETQLLMSVCTREKIEEMYGLIQEEYGTIDYYLIHILDVDIAKLRDKYLQ